MKIDLKELLEQTDLDEHLTEEAKNILTKWLQDKFLPQAKDLLEQYKVQLQESAKQESGWCKFRDAIFLPTLFTAGVWVFEKMLTKIVENTVPAAE